MLEADFIKKEDLDGSEDDNILINYLKWKVVGRTIYENLNFYILTTFS